MEDRTDGGSGDDRASPCRVVGVEEVGVERPRPGACRRLSDLHEGVQGADEEALWLIAPVAVVREPCVELVDEPVEAVAYLLLGSAETLGAAKRQRVRVEL